MDLENFKNNWKEEEVFPPEISLEKQNEIRNPLEKIKKNIKVELWSTLPIFPLTLWILYKMVEDKTIVLFANGINLIVFSEIKNTYKKSSVNIYFIKTSSFFKIF